MLTCVNQTLREANKALKKSKVSVPAQITQSEARSLMIICDILKPLAEWTDELQANGVTSSMVIVGLIDTMRSNYEASCEDN